jgi:hypothetical protein
VDNCSATARALLDADLLLEVYLVMAARNSARQGSEAAAAPPVRRAQRPRHADGRS